MAVLIQSMALLKKKLKFRVNLTKKKELKDQRLKKKSKRVLFVQT